MAEILSFDAGILTLLFQPSRRGGGAAWPRPQFEFTSEIFRSLAAFLEAIANHVQELIHRHPCRLRFIGVEILESFGP
jgi:hypothetical protein